MNKDRQKYIYKKIITYLFFYYKILIPAFCISMSGGLILGVVLGFSFKILILSYILLSLVFHYIIYELKYPNEYYFYYNLGFSKVFLWTTTLGINFILTIILLLIS